MSATAHIHDADLDPTKEQLAARFAGFSELTGSWRLVDPADTVGIEVLVGRDLYGRVLQFPVTYRPLDAALSGDGVLTEMDHSVLGRRSVAMATADPVAVAEFLRTILTGDTSAGFSLGSPCLSARGTGTLADAAVGDVELREVTRQRAAGVARVAGEHRQFVLRIAAQPGPARGSGTSYQTPRLRLNGRARDLFGDGEVVLADLYFQE